jgi:predicted lipoprotein with Yx(FWY)xxD motif
MKHLRKHFLALMILVAAVSLIGCTAKTTTATTAKTITTTTSTSTQTLQYSINSTSKTGIGIYLIDGKGMTLYWTSRDAVGQSNITGTTLANWPVFYPASISVPSSLNASDFSSITRADGSKQITFKGWPLYYYINDHVAGDSLGQGLAGVWFAVNPALSAPPAPTTTTTSAAVTTTANSSTATQTSTTVTTAISTTLTTSTTTTPTSTTTTSYSY